MLLTIDVGNTNIVFGLFEQEKLILKHRQATQKTSLDFLKPSLAKKIDQIIVASVVPGVDARLAKKLKQKIKKNPHFISARDFAGRLKLKVRENEVGADRLVNVYAAHILYKASAIIIDFGTATTFCALEKNGGYLGGAIAPGINLAREALHKKTAKLPLIEFNPVPRAIQSRTKGAMQSGLFFGYLSMVEGMVRKFKEELKDSFFNRVKVIATGGLAKTFAEHCEIFDIVDDDLTLKGLQLCQSFLK